MVGKIERSYKQTYKKKASASDPYLPKGASRKISVCGGCHAVYKNKLVRVEWVRAASEESRIADWMKG